MFRLPANGAVPILDRIGRLRLSIDRRRALALLLCVLVAAFTHRLVSKAQQNIDGYGTQRLVTVAATDLPRGHELQPGDTKEVLWPIALLPDGALSGEHTGEILVYPVRRNEIVVDTSVAIGVFGLRHSELALTIPTPLAPPPAEVGHQVSLIAVRAEDGTYMASSSIIASGRVVAIPDGGITVAIDSARATMVVDALANGAIEIAIEPG